MFFFAWSWVKERFISMNCAMRRVPVFEFDYYVPEFIFFGWILYFSLRFMVFSIGTYNKFFLLPNYIFSELSVSSNDKNFVEYHENIFQKKIKASKTHWTIRIETANLYGIGAQYLESSSWQRWSIVYWLESMASIFT